VDFHGVRHATITALHCVRGFPGNYGEIFGLGNLCKTWLDENTTQQNQKAELCFVERCGFADHP
jgi:hypothetical protein